MIRVLQLLLLASAVLAAVLALAFAVPSLPAAFASVELVFAASTAFAMAMVEVVMKLDTIPEEVTNSIVKEVTGDALGWWGALSVFNAVDRKATYIKPELYSMLLE